MECTSDPCVCSLDGECRDYCFPTVTQIDENHYLVEPPRAPGR